MQEVKTKTHLIITDIHNEFHVKWTGRFMDLDPLFINNKPIFVLVSSEKRVELNTFDLKCIERIAKTIGRPRGRQAITTDRVDIFVKQANGEEEKVGEVLCKKIKQYAPVFDIVGYKE